MAINFFPRTVINHLRVIRVVFLSIFYYHIRYRKRALLRTIKLNSKVYILGSGDSINKLSDEDFRDFSEHTTIGINYWTLHDFVPSIYFVELPHELKNRNHFLALLSKRIEENSHTRAFYTNSVKGDEQWRSLNSAKISSYLTLPMISYFKNVKYPKKRFALMMILMKFLRIKNLVLGNTSSLERIVQYCYLRGVREVVLVGMDFNAAYFFENDDFVVSNDIKLPPILNRNKIHKNNIHKTTDKAYTKFTTREFLNMCNEYELIKVSHYKRQ